MNHRNWPKAICVDLDNTLHDYSRAARIASERTAEYIEGNFGVPKHIVASRYEQVLGAVGTSGFKTGIACRSRRFRLLLDTWPETQQLDASHIAYEYGRQFLAAVAPNPGSLETLKAWQAEGRSVLIVTDGFADTQSAIFKCLGLSFLRRSPIVTFPLGVSKRDGSAYRLAVRMLAQDPFDIVMIGDNWDRDIVASSKCGMWQVWLSLAEPPRFSPPENFIARVNTIKEAKLAIEETAVTASRS
ncbi:MAG: HAD family hydrolase [Chthoniobacterales bacterium]